MKSGNAQNEIVKVKQIIENMPQNEHLRAYKIARLQEYIRSLEEER